MAIARSDQPLVRLLDVEPELAARLREDDRAEARERVRLRRAVIPAGTAWPAPEDRDHHAFGLLVLDGLMLEETQVAGRCSQQLLGAGDVVLPAPADDAASLDVGLRLIAATECQVAVLDDRLQGPFALWPGLALGLLEHVGRRLARSRAHTTIAQLPRVEDRLEATFWDLADRWGHVTPSGIRIPLRLTHQTLALIVGGRRPTISLALAALAERGIVMRHRDGSWLLVAKAPTLPPNERQAVAAPIARSAVESVPAPASAWVLDARQELLATTRRVAREHAAAVERMAVDLDRFERTRRASRALRLRTAGERRAREADRAARLTPSRPPAAPSAG